ncbi:MAG: hypothetical protein K2X86_18115 [Cytophagaceae bacterium]|nr:hypothetical protein [Cytophagaceae bacterium]
MRILVRFSLFTLLFSLITSSGNAQINEIYGELNKDKKSKTSNTSYSSSSNPDPGVSTLTGAFFIFDFFRFAGQGLYFAQKAALDARKNHREITSLEAGFYGGYYPRMDGFFYGPQVKANWGIFSTEFRQQRIVDGTGILDTYDWQVIKFNVPTHPVGFSTGLGFSRVPYSEITYLEYSVNGYVRFLKNRSVADIGYRATERNSSNIRFRREFKITLDYELGKFATGKQSNLRFCPMAGFTYQSYFNRINQYYFIAGLNLKLY